MTCRKANGEGSIYRRKDGRWAGAAFVDTVSGGRKRIQVLGRSRQEVHDKLEDKLTDARKGIRTPDKEWTVGAYLDYYLREISTPTNRPRTTELYERVIRLHLKPALGTVRLPKLTVQEVQRTLNQHVERTGATRTAQVMRNLLRAVLNRAIREELIVRNVAALADSPKWHRKRIQPWTVEEAARFLHAAERHRLYPAFIMLMFYGMRRGEVLGLRWCDINFALRRLRVRQQLQRIGGRLELTSVKTEAGERDLPLIVQLADALAHLYMSGRTGNPSVENTELRSLVEWARHDESLVFTSTTGTPLDPKNFVRLFHKLREEARLRRITVHHTRHTAATLLKNVGVPVKDVQLILGHAQMTTTEQIYMHADMAGQASGLARLEQHLLSAGVAVTTAVNGDFSTDQSTEIRAFISGGPSGARTQDTLLKSYILLARSLPFTPVIGHVRTRARTNILGWVAVKYCCQIDPLQYERGVTVDSWSYILHALTDAEKHFVRGQSIQRILSRQLPRRGPPTL